MVLGVILGSGIGLVGGLLTGSLIFGGPNPRDFDELDVSSDENDRLNAERKRGCYSEKDVRQILDLAPAWTKWPDYERVAWINRMIATLWPYYNRAIRNIVDETVTASLAQVCEQSKSLDSIEIEHMDLGKKPLQIGGIKTYETRDDEVIIEAPILWGSDARAHSLMPNLGELLAGWEEPHIIDKYSKLCASDLECFPLSLNVLLIRASAQVRLGPIGIYIPVEIRDIQLHAVARITIRPLVETLPCLGALYVSLLDPPHIDMTCTLINNIDLMAVPGIHSIAHSIVQKVIGGMMLYPNQFKVDLMEGGGLATPPRGMLRITLLKMEGLKSTDFMGKNDSYCLLEVREGRPQRSKTVKSNNPEFNEEFHLIVDDPESQNLKLTVKDDDFGWTDNVIGVCEIALDGSDAIQNPHETQTMSVDLMKEDEDFVAGMGNKVVQITTFGMVPKPTAPKVKRTNLGKVHLELTFLPFYRPEDEEEQEEQVHEEEEQQVEEDAPRNSQGPPSARRPNFARLRSMTNIRDDTKGVLTVTLTRCLHLAGKDTYVSFSLFDKEAKRTEIQRSSVVLNDNSPRWGDKFDFVMINANSFLVVTVMEKPGFMESMMTMKFVKKDDAVIGKVRIPVKDVVRNGRLKDKWPLQEVQQGEVVLMLTWTPCEFAQ